MKRLVVGLAAVTVIALGAAPLAAGEDPNDTQYGNSSQNITQEQAPAVSEPGRTAVAGTSVGSAAPGGTLPFTGLDLGVALAVGAAALGGGVALRRAGRKAEE
jgi:hypothetical protein